MVSRKLEQEIIMEIRTEEVENLRIEILKYLEKPK